MSYEYEEILKAENVTYDELPENVKSYIKKKITVIKTSATKLTNMKSKAAENPTAEDLQLVADFETKHAELVDEYNEDINSRLMPAISKIQEAKAAADAEAEAEKQRLAKEAEDKAEAERLRLEQEEKEKNPPAPEKRKFRLFSFTKTVDE